MALQAKPNPAHYALAELARKNKNFLTLSQNVDGLSPRASHPQSTLHLLHGSLFDIKCSYAKCDYLDRNNYTDPICPSLAIASEFDPTTKTSTSNVRSKADLLDPSVHLAKIDPAELPHCPKCDNLLRPGVVWFGEALPTATLSAVDSWIAEVPKIDLMLVIGTSAQVWPAAGYTAEAQDKGARVAVVNMDANDARGLGKGDWLFRGDAAEILPEILKPVIGELEIGKDGKEV